MHEELASFVKDSVRATFILSTTPLIANSSLLRSKLFKRMLLATVMAFTAASVYAPPLHNSSMTILIPTTLSSKHMSS